MFDQYTKTRLGNLLVEKGVISSAQLEQAIVAQQASRKPLGEILVEQNIITARQLKRTLKRQQALRGALVTAVLSACPFQFCAANDHVMNHMIDQPAAEQQSSLDSISLGSIFAGMDMMLSALGDSDQEETTSRRHYDVKYDMGLSQDSISVSVKFTF